MSKRFLAALLLILACNFSLARAEDAAAPFDGDLQRLAAAAGDFLDGLDIVVINAAGCPVARTALRRLGQPGGIAAVVAFLVGPDSGWISGQNLAADEGLLP